MRQDYAAARADRVNREWLRLSPGNRPLVRRIPPRDDGFPKGKHDDQVDSTEQFLDRFKTPMVGWGIYEFYRQKAEALAAAERGVLTAGDLLAVVRQQRGRSEG
jgi:hypothetical protein